VELTKSVIAQIFDLFIESFGTVINRIFPDNKLTVHAIFQWAVKKQHQSDQLALARQGRKDKSDPRIQLSEERRCRLEK
jgi:hypothetical protein